jgi:hypothetical protein
VTNPGWLDDIFAGMMLAVAGYSAGRLVAARVWSRPTHRDVDVAHVLMGTAMAGMLVSDLNPLSSGPWEVVFTGLALWFVWRCYQFVVDPPTDDRYGDHVHRLPRRTIHLVMSLAMLYMYAAAAPPELGSGGSMAMGAATGTTADFTLLPSLFVVALAASAIWTFDAIGRFSPSSLHVQQSPSLVATGTPSPTAASDNGTEASLDGPDRGDTPGAPGAPWLAPRLEAGSHIAMCFTMAYMLILML